MPASRSGPKPPPVTPPELERLLRRSAKARATFEKFPPSHKREVIGYIVEARKPETRDRRARKTVELLEEGWPQR